MVRCQSPPCRRQTRPAEAYSSRTMAGQSGRTVTLSTGTPSRTAYWSSLL